MSKVLFRRVKEDDLEQVYQLALEAGTGLTTLPADKSALKLRIEQSLQAFEKDASKPVDECYFFVLESLQDNLLIGTSAIEASVGYQLPFFSYALSKKTHISHELNLRLDFELLNCVNDLQGSSELATLFLSKNYRKNKNGLLLSRARLMYMRLFKKRFDSTVIAEMRGVSDQDGNSPFWSSLGERFFQMSFKEADKLSMITNKQFIHDLMPVHPVYVNMLSIEAKGVIGHAHNSTLPAMKILQREGFHRSNYVDIFDAGPTLVADLDDIRTIKDSQTLTVTNVLESVHADSYFISNTENDFRATTGAVMVTDNGASLSRVDAETLNVEKGSQVSISPTIWK